MAEAMAHIVPNLAAVLYDRGADADLLLFDMARRWQAQGVRLAGCVQVNDAYDPACACDMTLRDLSSGQDIRISQRLGSGARGCRLDSARLTEAVACAEAGLARGADLFILNKFGKMEATGRGFRSVIAAAVEQGAPVLVGLNAANRPAWTAFAGEAAILPPHADAIQRWWQSVRSREPCAA